MEKTFDTVYGTVTVKNVMFDLGTTLKEGIEIKGDDFDLIEVFGWTDISQLKPKNIENLILKFK